MAKNRDYNDAEALRLLSEGSEKAFRQIYDEYYLIVTRIGYQYLRHPRLVEDLVQEIFSTIWTHRTEFLKVENFKFYLYTMVKNLSRHHLKKIAREELARKEFLMQKKMTGNNIDEYLTTKEYNELARQAIEELPAPHKRVFQLIRVDGVSHQVAAAQLELSQQTVKNYLVLAMKSLKDRLANHIISSFSLAVSFISHLF
jgi:RNA polymerase sigma-70 factor (ECF subfamily)